MDRLPHTVLLDIYDAVLVVAPKFFLPLIRTNRVLYKLYRTCRRSLLPKLANALLPKTVFHSAHYYAFFETVFRSGTSAERDATVAMAKKSYFTPLEVGMRDLERALKVVELLNRLLRAIFAGICIQECLASDRWIACYTAVLYPGPFTSEEILSFLILSLVECRDRRFYNALKYTDGVCGSSRRFLLCTVIDSKQSIKWRYVERVKYLWRFTQKCGPLDQIALFLIADKAKRVWRTGNLVDIVAHIEDLERKSRARRMLV